MRVCTLTWYRGNNYGSVLQAYALQRVIALMGYPCETLAYVPTKAEAWKMKIKNHNVGATIEYKLNELCMKLKRQNTVGAANSFSRFDEFRNQNMKITKSCSTWQDLQRALEQYDVFVCGSDQIWNPYMFDPVYFLSFVKDTTRKIAYAPSFGVKEIPSFNQQAIKKQLETFRHLSVREERGAELVSQLTGQCAKVVVDPTLLLTQQQWESIAAAVDNQTERPYLLCYFLSKNDYYYRVASGIAEQLNLEIRMLPMVAEDFRKKETISQPVGPSEWIRLIGDAAFVLTDSFHCSLFAIRFHKSFYTLQRFSEKDKKGQNSRILNLLTNTGFTDRLVDHERASYEKIAEGRFLKAEEMLKSTINESRKYLADALAAVEEEGQGRYDRSFR